MSQRVHTVYGYPCVADPRDFSPDVECCSPEEIAAHTRACETFGTPAHVDRASWGIGVNAFCETQCDDCGSIENQTIHCWECHGDFCCGSCWPKHDAQETC